jgi:hypothetical protein
MKKIIEQKNYNASHILLKPNGENKSAGTKNSQN